MHNQYSHPTRQSKGVRFEPLPYDPNAHVITNVGAFAHCRRDRFCRCRKCKPPLSHRRDA